jgi:hypothetical protein
MFHLSFDLSYFGLALFQYQASFTDFVQKKRRKATTTDRSRRRGTSPLLNLNGDGDSTDNPDMEDIKTTMSTLLDTLKQCMVCGDTKRCKINKYGIHVNLTLQLVKAWAEYYLLCLGFLANLSFRMPRLLVLLSPFRHVSPLSNSSMQMILTQHGRSKERGGKNLPQEWVTTMSI